MLALSAVAFSCALTSSLLAAPTRIDLNIPPAAPVQRLVVIGGGARPEDAMRQFVDWSGPTSRILVVPWASRAPVQAFTGIERELAALGVFAIERAAPPNPKNAARFREQLSRATAVFLSGGDQERLMRAIDAVGMAEQLRRFYDAGNPVAGTSAGASVVSDPMIAGRRGGNVRMAAGLGLLPAGIVVDQHVDAKGRERHLSKLVAAGRAEIGVGIDEATAISLIGGHEGRVYGRSSVRFSRGARDGAVSEWALSSGDRFELGRGLLPSRGEFEDWARGAAVGIDKLDESLQGKSLVFLGEPHHFIDEKYAFRLMAIRRLVGLGWRTLGMEMGRSDARRVDRYLETGDEGDLVSSGLYSRAPAWFRDAEIRFWRDVRAISEAREPSTPRIRAFGYDLDMAPGGGYGDIRAVLAAYGHEPAVQRLLEALPRAGGGDALRRAIRYAASSRRVLKRILGAAAFDDVWLSLLSLDDSFRFKEAGDARDGRDEAFWAQARRERTMFREMRSRLRAKPDEKIMLTGHDMHLGKDNASLATGSLGSRASRMWPSIGAFLARRLPQQVYSIWMLFSRVVGEAAPAVARDLGESLSAAGRAFFLPFSPDPRAEYADQPLNFRVNDDFYASGNVRRQADALFYAREVHRLDIAPDSSRQ